MYWQVVILVHSLVASARSILLRDIGTSKRDLSQYLLMVSFLCVAIGGAVVFYFEGMEFNASLASQYFWWIVYGGILIGLTNYLVIVLNRHADASVIALTSFINPLSVMFFAVIFYGETLTTRQIIGASLMLLASVSVKGIGALSNRKRQNPANMRLVSILVLVIALTFGLAITNERYLIDRIGLGTYLIAGWGGQTISVMAMLAIMQIKKPMQFPATVKMNAKVWLSALLLVGVGITFVYTISISKSASVTTLASSFKILLTVVLAYIFLNEHGHMLQKFISLIIGSAGLWLLFVS